MKSRGSEEKITFFVDFLSLTEGEGRKRGKRESRRKQKWKEK